MRTNINGVWKEDADTGSSSSESTTVGFHFLIGDESLGGVNNIVTIDTNTIPKNAKSYMIIAIGNTTSSTSQRLRSYTVYGTTNSLRINNRIEIPIYFYGCVIFIEYFS